MERQIRRLIEEYKRSDSPPTQELLRLIRRTGYAGMSPSISVNMKWIIAFEDNELPALTQEEYMSSDPDIMPHVSVGERVTVYYPDGTIADKRYTRTTQISDRYVILHDDMRPTVSIRPYLYHSNPEGMTAPFPPLYEACRSVDFMTFIEIIKRRKRDGDWFSKKLTGANFFREGLPRTEIIHYADGSGDYKIRAWRSRTKSKAKMKSWSRVPIDRNDANPRLYRAVSRLKIVDSLSHPMLRSMNKEQLDMMLNWSKAQ